MTKADPIVANEQMYRKADAKFMALFNTEKKLEKISARLSEEYVDKVDEMTRKVPEILMLTNERRLEIANSATVNDAVITPQVIGRLRGHLLASRKWYKPSKLEKEVIRIGRAYWKPAFKLRRRVNVSEYAAYRAFDAARNAAIAITNLPSPRTIAGLIILARAARFLSTVVDNGLIISNLDTPPIGKKKDISLESERSDWLFAKVLDGAKRVGLSPKSYTEYRRACK